MTAIIESVTHVLIGTQVSAKVAVSVSRIQSHHQNIAPSEDEESLSFLPLAAQDNDYTTANPTFSSNNIHGDSTHQHHAANRAPLPHHAGGGIQLQLQAPVRVYATSTNSSTNIALAGERAPNNNIHNHSQGQTQPGADVDVTIIAVAVPETIRPPKLRKATDPAVKNIKKLIIFLCGMFMAFLFYLDASVFLYGSHYMHRFTYTVAAILWSFAALALVVGSILGARRGEWRMLAPGIVLSHAASFLIRWIV